MKPSLIAFFAKVTFCTLIAGHAAAIIVSGDAPQEAVFAEPTDYPEVIPLLDGRAVGTLVADKWIVTAAHVGQIIDRNAEVEGIVVGGKSNGISAVFIHPSWDDAALGAPGVIDIALLQLARPLSGLRPAPLYRGKNELDSIVTLVGWGRTGDGMNDNLVRDGRFRRGENRVDAVTPRLRFRFDEPGSARALPLEAVSGPGDSGGPAFIKLNGVRQLAGVSSFQADITTPGIYGVIENYERVSDHIDWIAGVIRKGR